MRISYMSDPKVLEQSGTSTAWPRAMRGAFFVASRKHAIDWRSALWARTLTLLQSSLSNSATVAEPRGTTSRGERFSSCARSMFAPGGVQRLSSCALKHAARHPALTKRPDP